MGGEEVARVSSEAICILVMSIGEHSMLAEFDEGGDEQLSTECFNRSGVREEKDATEGSDEDGLKGG